MGQADCSLHNAIDFLGMRAQGTAVGLIQLTIELKRAGVIDEAAVSRIKDAIADEIARNNRPRSMGWQAYQGDVRHRLDRVFEGAEPIMPMPETVAD